MGLNCEIADSANQIYESSRRSARGRVPVCRGTDRWVSKLEESFGGQNESRNRNE